MVEIYICNIFIWYVIILIFKCLNVKYTNNNINLVVYESRVYTIP